ncbi:MAG: J domain-containing protein, partial [Candidatus Woesearchaeota archaeon]
TREVERTFRLNIRKGFRPGKPIVLRGEGHTGENGGENGNIVVVPQLKPHNFFRHNGPHLECTVPIYFTQAILGDTIHIKHPNGETLWVEVPPKTTHGSIITLKNKGYPVAENSYGDLKIKIHIEMPDELSTEEEELIKQLHTQSDKKKKEFNFK